MKAYDSPEVSRLPANLLAVIAAVQLLGGHWLALQSVAWARMVISYAQEESFVDALEKTFSGENPCQLCHAVKVGQSEEKKQEITKTLVKVDAILMIAAQVPQPKVSQLDFVTVARIVPERRITPPTPPPLA